VVGSCEHGNGHSVSVKFAECLGTKKLISVQKLLLFIDVMVLFS